MKTGTQLNTKVEIGKEFLTIETHSGELIIKTHTCKTIEVSEGGVLVIGEHDFDFELKSCYRYIQDTRNAVEIAINKLGAKDEN